MRMDAKISVNLKIELKKDFEEKVKNSNYKGVSDALNNLIIDFLEERKYDKLDIENTKVKTSGFYLNDKVKVDFDKYVKETKEFTNSTDAITKIIYNYVNKYDF